MVLPSDTVMHPVLGSYLLQAATAAPLLREGLRQKPSSTSAGAAKAALEKAYMDRHQELGLTVDPVKYNEGSPTIQDVLSDPASARQLGTHRSGTLTDGRTADEIGYNPNASREVLAHEMGHAVSRKTDIGGQVRKLRGNPKLAMALAAASGLVPITNAILTPGDDDYDEGMMANVAFAAPTLIDEGLATKNALAMMDAAGMRATLGQRGRLAGGLLSYVAAPIASAALGTAIGNQFDENI